jgi:hypothetical protein
VRIVQGFPPNIQEIKKKFPITVNTVYAYGSVLYNPSGQPILDDCMAHEETHQRQQQSIGIDEWWNLYLNNEGFRLTQEVEAYREQYRFISANFSRDVRRSALQKLAKDLSSPLYGDIIKKRDAEELIENYE